MKNIKLSALLLIFALYAITIGGMNRSNPPSLLSKIEQETLDNRLFEAIRNMNKQEIEQLMSQGANPNSVNEYLDTPLHVIVKPLTLHETMFPHYLDWSISLPLLDAGADPNAQDGHGGYTPLQRLLMDYNQIKQIVAYRQDAQKFNQAITNYILPLFKTLLLHGARLNRGESIPQALLRPESGRSDFLKLLPLALPQPLLQAIILNDAPKVKSLLKTETLTTDDNGISALAYAAGQGHEQILSLLLKQHAYQYDTKGLEQGLEIVSSRLKALDPKSEEHKKYQAIFEGLKKELGSTYDALVRHLTQLEHVQGANPTIGAPEIGSMIAMQLFSSPAAYQALFNPQGK
jgi:ankyrin repeat protein